MKLNTISSLCLGIYSLSGLCILHVNAEASVQSYPPEIRRTHSLAARAEHDDEPTSSEPVISSSGEDWTGEEEQRLLKLRGERKSWAEVAKSFPGRSGGAISTRYYELTKDPLKKSRRGKSWTDEENDTLRDLLKIDASWEERAVYLPGRTPKAVRSHYNKYLRGENRLPDKFIRQFETEEDEILLELDEEGIPWKDRVSYFDDRTLGSVQGRITRLKPSKGDRLGKFTPKEDGELIEALGLGMTVEEICELLGRKEKGVRRRILILEQSNRLDRAPQMSSNRPYTDAEFELMREGVEKGMSWREIAAEHFPHQTHDSIRKAYNRYRARKQREEENE